VGAGRSDYEENQGSAATQVASIEETLR
jgi:hypothetical protein